MTQQNLFGGEDPQPTEPTEKEKLQAVMVTMEATRGFLIDTARDIAHELVKLNGQVTSVEVFRELRDRGYGAHLDAVDPRWMGAVFRTRGWLRVGWREVGSHCRPVSVWRLV